MATQPAGDATLTDEDLDAAVQSMFEDDEPSTAAPEPAPEGATADEAVGEPETAPEPAEAAAGDAPPADPPETRPDAQASAVPAIPAGSKPFQFKASGSVHTLDGAHELPDGSVLVSKDALTELRRTFANERDLSQSFRQTKREFDRRLKDAQTQRTAKDAEADAAIALVADLVKKSPEEQWQYLQEFSGNIPRLQLDLERKKLEEQQRLFEQQRQGPQLSPEEQQEQIAEQVQGELEATFQFIAQSDEFKTLTADEKQAIRARYQQNPHRLLRRATQDDPAQGITKGDLLFDPTELLDDLRWRAQQKPKPQPTKAAEANATRNADLQQRKQNAIPPVVRNQPVVGQPRDTKTGRFTDRKQFEKDFMKDDDDEAA